mmetsp:Transcript_3680/g.8516  ORF Transcript_3680/g.8516 Transcript_3680/m.8516 type:complete len:208 (-) Transcript_3680:2932-3555(-)
MVSSGGTQDGKEGRASSTQKNAYCEPSASQEDMMESALLLASLAGHSPKGQKKKRDDEADSDRPEVEEGSTKEEQELPTTPTASNVSRPLRRDSGAECPFAANANAHRPPPPVLPQVQVEADDSIPKPNIVTPVSSETGRFVEELHHHQRVEFPPTGRSFYQLQERGARISAKAAHASPFHLSQPPSSREEARAQDEWRGRFLSGIS